MHRDSHQNKESQMHVSPHYKNAYERQGWPFFKKNPPFHKMPNRSIYSNIADTAVCDNSIKTSKYTFYNFVPKNLIVQFSKVANLYFLIIGIMQMVPSISVSGGFPVIFMPLAIVIGTSAIKDYYEDLKRKKSDRQINLKPVTVLNSKAGGQPLFEKTWAEVRIGQIIKIEKNQSFSADVILLASSQPNQDCFVQTKNLDGQTNLKFKKIQPAISSLYLPSTPELQALLSSHTTPMRDIHKQFKYERPNPYIHSFTGSFGNVPLNANNIVLRGCSLKMTNWVYGLVIYTGVDTKIMLNSNKTRQKKSRLQFRMGIIVAIIFLLQMLLTFTCALLGVVANIYEMGEEQWIHEHREYTKDEQTFNDQIELFEEKGNQLFVNWGSWILLFTNFVPISLIVSLEMVKYIQGTRISVKEEKKQIIVQTSTLNEELGQIQHLFSDKTGTLTKNYMTFKYMMAGTRIYGYGQKTAIPDHISNVEFYDQQLMNFLNKQKLSPAHHQNLFDLFLAFSICHNVILQRQEESSEESAGPKYNASSPDQLAFINMARYAGWEYLGIDSQNNLKIRYKESILKYKLLHTLEFNSDRKRMSIIVEQAPTHNNENTRVFVFMKGADNVIFERTKDQLSEKIEKIKQKLEGWSLEGLRTLVFAKREIKKEYYDKWAKMYAFSLSNLQKKETQERSAIRQMADNIQPENKKQQGEAFQFNLNSLSRIIIEQSLKESPKGKQSPFVLINKLLTDHSLTESQKRFLDLHLKEIELDRPDHEVFGMPNTEELELVIQKQLEVIGATAIEDKLQDNAKQIIQKIRKGNVKVWMLTGDKKQTAINIGISCGIVAEDMAILYWKDTLEKTIEQRQNIRSRDCCLVVSGEELLAIEDQDAELVKLINSCEAIVCCRVTPKQKQDMVWLMRKNRFTTLAIGDGANDVNMINTAHVGVGIKGVEGAQAALCSDYAISQFQILGQLMLYHGRQCYRKNSNLILFNFYKNLLLVLPQFWYGFNNGFSPCNIYDPWIYQLYNVIFTSLPIMIYAILDEKFSLNISMQKPQLYRDGVNNKLFCLKKIIVELAMPVIFSFFITTITFLGTQKNALNGGGWNWNLISEGMTIFVSCVIICNLRIIILSVRFSKILILTILVSVVLYFVAFQIASQIFWNSGIANAMNIFLHSPDYYLIVFTNVCLVGLIEYFFENWQSILAEEARIDQKSKNTIEMKLLDKNSDNLNEF